MLLWEGPGVLGWLAENAAAEAVGSALFRQAGGEAELLRVATRPAWRRGGVARRLLAGALAELDAAGVDCFLEVRADNLAAQQLYSRLGFSPTGLRRGYYRDGCDARLFARRALP
jgi:[ribosomal protein S18]-alanine N-acetyltransferase